MKRKSNDGTQAEMAVKLVDEAGGRRKEVSLRSISNHHIEIKAKGYGDCGSKKGYGAPAIIELYDGKLRIVAWADINQEDPTHTIDLSDAKEGRRGKDTPARTSQVLQALVRARDAAANDTFSTYDFKEEGVTVEDSEGWETDGPDRYIRKIYYVVDGEQQDQTTAGSFIVDFKRGTAVVEDCHANL